MTEDPKEPAAARPGRRRSNPVIALACCLEWIVPGTGYLVLGSVGRGLAALAVIGLLFAAGLHLNGQLDRPMPNQFLSTFAAFGCMGVGAPYFVVRQSDALNRGLGDVTSATFEYGTTFLRAAGLLSFLLLLDVFDIGVGRKP